MVVVVGMVLIAGPVAAVVLYKQTVCNNFDDDGYDGEPLVMSD